MTHRMRIVYDVVLALLVAMTAASVLILLYGQSPLRVYQMMLFSTWGSVYGIGQVLFKATPLCFTGLAVAFAFRAGLFNIGGEGQLAAGAFAAAVAGACLPADTSTLLALPITLSAAIVAGASLGAIPGVLKAYRGAHEVITTIMLNFVVSATVLYLGNRFFFLEETTHTASIAPGAILPSLGLGDSAANASLFLALCAAFIVFVIFKKTILGFELAAIGENSKAAEAGGVSISKRIILAMSCSGALAGLAGVGFVLGNKHYFEDGMGRGAGFMGIAVALMGRNHPFGIGLAALLFGTLNHGGLAINHIVPKEIIDVLQAVIILTVAIGMASSQRGNHVDA